MREIYIILAIFLSCTGFCEKPGLDFFRQLDSNKNSVIYFSDVQLHNNEYPEDNFNAYEFDLTSQADPSLVDTLDLSDPMEGLNRSMDACNDAVMLWLLRPFGILYASIFPRFMIDGIHNIGVNAELPSRFGSCLLQGRAKDAGEDSLVFLINTTLGAGGFWKPAQKWFKLNKHDEDFGQAFASWGIGPGCYIYLPVHGPTTLRDGVGLIFDYGLDPKSYIGFLVPGAGAIFVVNKGVKFFEDYKKLRDANVDPYTTIKDFWFIYRTVKVEQ